MALFGIGICSPCFADIFSNGNTQELTPVHRMDDRMLFASAQLRRDQAMHQKNRFHLNRQWLDQNTANTLSGAVALRELLKSSVLSYLRRRDNSADASDNAREAEQKPALVSWSNYSVSVSQGEAHVTFQYHY